MARYLSQNTFDPVQEILKEKNIQNFFKQKYNILMMYLEETEGEQSNDQSLRKKLRNEMNRGLLVVDKINNNPLESTKTEVPFTSAQEKIKTIEDEVSIELNRDWDEKNKEIQEKEQIEKNIKEFYEKLLLQKKRIQMFVDPRSTKFRKNFKVVNEHIKNIRKVDPSLNLGKKRRFKQNSMKIN